MFTQQDINEIAKLIEEKLEEKTKLLPNKDEFFSKMNEVIGELKAIREEQSLQVGRISEHSDELEELNQEVKDLKKNMPQLTRTA